MYDTDGIAVIVGRVASLKERYAIRDFKANAVRAVKEGRWEDVAPGAFTEEYPAPMVANRIEVMGRDVAASLAALPSLVCSATNGLKDAPKRFAENRTKIANRYVEASNLKAHMTDYASGYDSFGMGVFFVEPDFEEKMPVVRVRDGSRVYAAWDGRGRTVRAFEEWTVTRQSLVDEFPAAAELLERWKKEDANEITVVRYSDRIETVVYLPDCGNHIVSRHKALAPGRCQYVCVPRPNGSGNTFGGIPRGAYDDLIYPQLVAHEFRLLQLEAASKAVQAPLAVPNDVTDVSYGPDAVIHTANPQGVRRVELNIPQAAFAATAMVEQDLAIGGMSPEARTGNIQASVITGKGIEAASAGYSSQIANAQIMFAFGLEQVIELCFAVDEALWPNVTKEIQGSDNGSAYSLRYRPSKDIKGDYSVKAEYGFLTGMAPNNALVFILQAQAAGLVSRDFAARQLPIGMNVGEEMGKIEQETIRGSLLNALAAMGQAIPSMVMQGQDPQAIILGFAEIMKSIQKGEPLEEAIAKAFAPKPPPPPAPGEAVPGDEAAAPPGSEPGVAGALGPQASALGPNDRPDLAMFFAGLSGAGSPVLQGGVSRQNPVQGQ